MGTKATKKPLAIALGTAFAACSFAATAMADGNPFQADELKNPSSYDQLAEGNCGEGSCGGDDDKDAEGSCGEGSCGNG
ncbi:hypothetical protein M0534_02300 [Methylonatrum kenyense]|uniref:HvfA family oxazolone/thioamide-modified RiPP metallophore n=1 Tax=Methylonatrum kenyense TaxID=455253 RepID=UPI0020BE16B5|nr:hypothetical protein [Methylonatrum kenyense]MCK8515166.1 hypothetical protein [Methylonatrum kenyense]